MSGSRLRFFAVATAAVLPVLIFGVVVTFWLDLRERSAVEDRLRQAAGLAIEAVDRGVGADLDAVRTLALMLAEVPATAMPGRFHALGPATLRVRPAWVGLILSEAGTGRAIARLGTPNLMQAAEAPDPDGLAMAAQGRQARVAGVLRHPALPQPVVPLHVPVVRDDGVPYVVTALLRADNFSEFLGARDLPEGWRAGLLDQNGRIVARSREGAMADASADTGDAAARRVRAGPPGRIVQVTMGNGASAHMTFSRSGLTGWSTYVGVPAEVLWAPSRAVKYAAAGGAAVCLLLSACLFAVTGRAMGRSEEAERERAANRRVAEVAANFPGAIYRRVLHRDGTISYPYVSAGFGDITGVPIQTGTGPVTLDAIAAHFPDPQDGVRWREALAASARSLQPFVIEYHARSARGEARWMRSVAHPHRMPDGEIAWDGVTIDITEQKSLEADLRAAKERAERADRAKSRFLAAASHDLRQPAQSLSLLTAALEQRLKGHEAWPQVHAVEQAAEAMRRLLEGMLDISRLDAGLVEPKLEAVEIGPLLSRLVGEYRLHAAGQGLDLRIVPTTAWAWTDAHLIERILRNLLENALKYTETGRILIGCRRRGGQVVVAVHDTGIGIAPDRQQEIFEEFVQLGNPERDRAKGLGLGLAVVRLLADLLGHGVEVRSVPGRGSCFSIGLPARPAPARVQPGRPALASAPAAGRGLVVVIDDEGLILAGLRAILEGWGWQVLTAESEEEALRRLEEHAGKPEAILADYRLRAGRTGLQAIAALRRSCGRNVPALLLTGDMDDDRLRDAAAADARLVHKPVDPVHLGYLLQELTTRAPA